MQFLWKYIDDLVGKGLDWSVIAELLFYASLTLVPMAMPLSVLLAAIMTFGNLGEKNELFAMKSGGISLYRIMLPLLIFNIFVSISSFYFCNDLLPYTNLKMRSLLFSIQEQRPEVNIQNGIFSEPVDGLSIKADRKSRANSSLENILIYDHRDQLGNTNVTTAQFGDIKITKDKAFLILDLYNGCRYEDLKSQNLNSNPYQKSKFEHQTVYIELDGLGLDRSNEDLFKSNFEMIDNSQLLKAVDSLRIRANNREYETWNNIVSYSMFKAIPKDFTQNVSESKEDYISDLKKYDFDSIYNNATKQEKVRIYESALNYTRSAKTSIDIISEEITLNNRWVARHEIEWHRKYSLSIACLLFYIIGAPLGAIIRKGGFGLPVIISVVIFLFYYILSITFENTVRELVFSAEFGMWISTYVLIPVAIFLIIKSGNDSMRLSTHFYKVITKFFKRKSTSPKKSQ